jgi:hypothetical protein
MPVTIVLVSILHTAYVYDCLLTKLRMPSSSSSSLVAIKPKNKKESNYCIFVNKSATKYNFIDSKLYYHTSYHHPKISVASVALIPQLRASAMFFLLIVGDYKVRRKSDTK